MAKKIEEVVESIKKIDSELLDLRSKEDILYSEIEGLDSDLSDLYNKKRELRAEKEAIIKDNYEIVLEYDLKVISKTIEVYNAICNKEYTNFSETSIRLNRLFEEVNTKFLRIKEDSSVNAVEESVEMEAN